jgi:hypothetical protein
LYYKHTEPFGSGIGRLYQTEGLIITGCTDEFQGESISSDSEKSDFIIPCLNLSLELHYVEESSPISENKQSQLRTAISEMALTWKPYIAVDVVDDWITGTDYLVYCLPIITTRKRESPYFWSGNGDDQVIVFGGAYYLILTRNTTGTYRHVGVVDLFNAIGWEDVCLLMHIAIV